MNLPPPRATLSHELPASPTPPDEWALPEVKVFSMPKFGDHRGFFSETYGRTRMRDEHGIACEFVQDNHSLSACVGTVRGLHFQKPPFAQAKLVRVIRGAILDVAVDVRRGSPTIGRYVAAMISREGWNAIFVPIGFAHGFCTLQPDTEVAYKVSSPYAPEHEGGIRWDDPGIGITWPVDAASAVLSDKDRTYPLLGETGGWIFDDFSS